MIAVTAMNQKGKTQKKIKIKMRMKIKRKINKNLHFGLVFLSFTKFAVSQTLSLVSLLYENSHEPKWYPELHVHNMAARKILLTATILYTGSTYQSIKEMMKP